MKKTKKFMDKVDIFKNSNPFQRAHNKYTNGSQNSFARHSFGGKPANFGQHEFKSSGKFGGNVYQKERHFDKHYKDRQFSFGKSGHHSNNHHRSSEFSNGHRMKSKFRHR